MPKPQYDPFRHHRRSVRYTDWDYRTPGYYFITICVDNREPLFQNQAFYEIAHQRLMQIQDNGTWSHVVLDHWVIMPNHIHLILLLTTWPEAIQTEPEKKEGFSHVQAGSIGAIVGTYKTQVTTRINNLRRQKGSKFWQTGYWDRIIRDEAELNKTRQYIIDNPRRWEEDRDNLDTLLTKMVYHK